MTTLLRRSRPSTWPLGTSSGVLAALVLTGWALQRWRESRYSLRGRVVLITGGSRGLGLLLARECARNGARLVLAARDADTLERAVEELQTAGAEVAGVPCDVSIHADAVALVEESTSHFGRIDVVINCAGQIEVGPIQSMTLRDFENAMNTNFWGAVNVTDAALPRLIETRGRVVNISSIGGIVSLPHLVPYSASKFALTGFSLGLRTELAPKGVSVVTVCPGLMRTGSPINAEFKGDHAAEYAWFSAADSLPILSISARRAARAIVRAARRGDVLLKVGLTAKLGALAAGLFPETLVRASSAVARLLPRAEDTLSLRGRDIEPRPAGWLTALGDEAAAENNELSPSS